MSAKLIRALINRKLTPQKVSLRWTKRFLRSIGLRFRNVHTVAARHQFSPLEKQQAQDRLKMKLWRTMREFSMPRWRVVKFLDETSVSLAPGARHAWTVLSGPTQQRISRLRII